MRVARALLLHTTLLIVGITLVAPSSALAQEDGPSKAELRRAKRYFKKGEKLFALGRFDQALEQYETAFEEAPLPEFLFNIGQCQRNLGDYDGAIFSYRKYLKLKPEAVNRESVEKLIEDLKVKIEEEDNNRPDIIAPPPPKKKRTRQSRPFYKHWAFWTGIAVVAASATTTVILVSGGSSLPRSDLGNLDFGK